MKRVGPHLARVHAYARRLAGPDAGPDLAQEALVRAFERQGSFESGRPVLPWLLALVHNLHVDRRRAFDPIGVADDADGDRDLCAPAGDPEAAVAGAEVSGLVENALARLPVDQRSCVVLYHVEGLSLEEVSEAVGVPVGTVKSRLSRGRHALAEMLSGLWEETAMARGGVRRV